MRLSYRRIPRAFFVLVVALETASTATTVSAATLFESGTLGQIGVTWDELIDQVVPGTNVNAAVFTGVRFQLTQPSVTTEVGGHFVGPTSGTFFGAIVELADENDFPDSEDLSTPDVLGSTLLTFPILSGEVSGPLNLSLDTGWYALVFGSGLFAADASGGAVRNGDDIGEPTYVGHQAGIGWYDLGGFQDPFRNHRFVVEGIAIPEPASVLSCALLMLALAFAHNRIFSKCVEARLVD